MMKGIFLKIGIILIILGSFISLLSGFSAVVETDFEVEHVASVVNSNVLGFEILEKNGFSVAVNVTGFYSLGVFPKLRIYNQQEQIIFSFPISEFPITTNVYEEGVFTLILENVTLGSNSWVEVTRTTQKKEIIEPLIQLNDMGFSIGIIGSIILIISFCSILTKNKDDPIIDDDLLKAELCLSMDFNSSKSGLYYIATAIFLPLYVFIAFGAFVFPMVFARLNIPDNGNLSIFFSLVLLVLTFIYSLFYKNILNSRFVKINCQRLLTLTDIARYYNVVIVIFGILAIASFPLGIIFKNIDVFSLAFFTFWAVVVVYIPFFPFSSLLSDKTLAVILLKKYLEEYSSNPEEPNFSLLVKSTKNISDMVKPYNIKISPKLLALGLIYNGLQENQEGIKDLLKVIMEYPKEKSRLVLKLKELMTNAIDLDKTGLSFEFPRFSSERMWSSIKNILTFTSLIFAIIYYLLNVLEVI